MLKSLIYVAFHSFIKRCDVFIFGSMQITIYCDCLKNVKTRNI